MQIWKYELLPFTKLEVPVGGKILCVREQFEKPCVWILVDPYAAKETRGFHAIATGQNIDPAGAEYLGTVYLQGGALVFHIFESMTPRAADPADGAKP